MNYLSWEKYEKLYKRYISHSPVNLFAAIDGYREPDFFTDKRILDLCCGTGRLSMAAVERGATAVAIDGCFTMMKIDEMRAMGIGAWLGSSPYKHGRGAIVNSLKNMHVGSPVIEPGFDYVFCQQAANIWLHEEFAAEETAMVLKPGGKFVFNTFNTKPETIPSVKSYVIENLHYNEISWFVSEDRMVHHVQICEGEEPHCTAFRWISQSEYYDILHQWFKIEKKTKDRTDIYICEKK